MRSIVASALALLLAACAPRYARFVPERPAPKTCTEMHFSPIDAESYAVNGRTTRGECLSGYLGEFMLVDIKGIPYSNLRIKCPCPMEDAFVSVYESQEHAIKAADAIRERDLKWLRRSWGYDLRDSEGELSDFLRTNPFPRQSPLVLAATPITPEAIDLFVTNRYSNGSLMSESHPTSD